MEQLYLVKLDDDTWLSGISPTGRVTSTENWKEAKFYQIEELSDLEWIINHKRLGTVYLAQISEPKPTQLSTVQKDGHVQTIKPMHL